MGRSKTGSKANSVTSPGLSRKASTSLKADPKKDAQIAKSTIEKKLAADEQGGATSTQVDSFVPGGDAVYQVHADGATVYSVYLMWSDLRKNSNKYYIVQILRKRSGGAFFEWTRYGRVGYTGQTSLVPLSNAQEGISYFNKKSNAKQRKGYTEIKMALGKKEAPAGGDHDANEKARQEETKGEYEQSKLDGQVQELIEFIFDHKLMEASVVNMNYDVKKMPLGELSKETILKAYQCLKEIENVILKKNKGDLASLSGQFYTLIPHNFGFSNMASHIINTDVKLKEKLDLIQTLADIQTAQEISVKKPKAKVEEAKQKPNPLDENYKKLNCDIQPLTMDSSDYKMINTYVQNTAGYRKLQIVDAFHIERKGEADQFNPQNLDNKTLLWHGSRFSNFVGILAQGMRIAPPEAPSTGYLFGKGVYFADLVGKSAPYCRPEISNNIATFVLCEVALGNQLTKNRPDFDSKLPSGYNSKQAIGNQQPAPSGTEVMFGDVNVPLGKVQDVKGASMGANEFIVYNTNQIKMRYLVRCKVN